MNIVKHNLLRVRQKRGSKFTNTAIYLKIAARMEDFCGDINELRFILI